MAAEALVDEEVDVLVRVLRDGSVQPTSFLWRDRTLCRRPRSPVGRVEGRARALLPGADGGRQHLRAYDRRRPLDHPPLLLRDLLVSERTFIRSVSIRSADVYII